MKLYLVKLRGMQSNIGGNIAYGKSYVLADDSDSAYKKVKNFVDKEDLGFAKDRELESVELLAYESRYNYIGTMIFI